MPEWRWQVWELLCSHPEYPEYVSVNAGDGNLDNACASASSDDVGAGGCVAFPLKLHTDDGGGDVRHQLHVCARAYAQESHVYARVRAVP